jgi:O-antigen ligase
MVLIIFNRRSYFLNRLGFLLFFCFFILACFPGLFLPKLEDAFLDLQYLLLNFFKAYAQDGSHKTVDAGFIRLGLWEGTIKMFFDSPKKFLLGIGPETFPYQFPFYRPPSLNFSSEWDFILNKPHNYYLEMCAETGIFSLFFYLLILIKGILRKHPWVPSLLVSFAIVNFFGWPTVTTSLYFWIIMAGVFKNYEF